MQSMKSNELRWQAESDARTMAQYEEIMNDKPRLQRAMKEARKQAADLQKRANAMSIAANKQQNSSKKK